MNPRTPTFALLLLVTFALSGCDFFRPARPEVGPEGNLPPVHTDYSLPDKTLDTIQAAIQDKSATNGQSAYIDGFADPASDGEGFTTTFDPNTLARWSAQDLPPTDWNLDREQLFYTNLSRFASGFQYFFTWEKWQAAGDDISGSTTATLYRSYRLTAKPADRDTLVNEAYGNAELQFVLVGNKWKIVKWIDHEDPHADFEANQVSFGYLRLQGP